MTFSDIFKSSFLENVTSVSLLDMVLALVLAFGIGLFIFFVYKKTYGGVMYSSSFGVTLIALTMITTLVILAVTSNIVLSLGMVGALSIVRFRAPVKDPLDVGFLYWSIAAGLTAGARLYMVAIFGTAVIGLVYLAMRSVRRDARTFLLILRYASPCEERVEALLQNLKYTLKNRSVTREVTELTLEVRVKKGNTAFMKPFASADFLESAALVEYNGTYS